MRTCEILDHQTGLVSRPLQQVPLGSTVRIVRVDHEHPDRMVRLSRLGLVPGTTLRVRQRWPALIIGVGQTVLALDGELGSGIHVQQVAPEKGPCKKSR